MKTGKYLSCMLCGTKKYYEPWQLKRLKQYHFCSNKCSGVFYKENKIERKSQFKKGKLHPLYNPEKHIIETRECACGCGKTLECAKSESRKFIHGHNPTIHSKGTKEELSALSRRSWQCCCQ